MSLKLGCVALGTPDVEIVLIHFDVTAAKDCTPPSVDAVGFGSCAAATEPEISVNAGCDDDGTPLVEIDRIHWLPTPTYD